MRLIVSVLVAFGIGICGLAPVPAAAQPADSATPVTPPVVVAPPVTAVLAPVAAAAQPAGSAMPVTSPADVAPPATAVSVAPSEDQAAPVTATDAKLEDDATKDTIPYAGDAARVFGDCRNRYYPAGEVRYLSEIPITIMFTKPAGAASFKAAPAIGLDALGLWWAPLRPYCQNPPRGPQLALDNLQTVYTSRRELFLYLIASANVSYLAASRDDAVSTDGMTSVNVERSIAGAYLSLSVGAFFDAKWVAGGHRNRIGIGVLARYGAFFSNDPMTPTQGLFGLGPALRISL